MSENKLIWRGAGPRGRVDVIDIGKPQLGGRYVIRYFLNGEQLGSPMRMHQLPAALRKARLHAGLPKDHPGDKL